MLQGGGWSHAIENNGEDNPTKVYRRVLNRAEGSTVFPSASLFGHPNRLGVSMNLESHISEFSEVERELEEPVSNTLRAAGRPPASAVFGLLIALSVFGSAAYLLCFYLK
jgi:hypothetical protein